jgi:adenine deaminase
VKLAGNIIDIPGRRVFSGEITVQNGVIESISPLDIESDLYLLPGFIDAHVHIESSMLIPSQFARLAVVHGTVATVSDPHEIANVLGIEGVKYMIENGRQVPFKFYFGAPSCVPATHFETAGAVIDAGGVRALLEMPEIKYLAEMMNYPGVLAGDPEVLAKIHTARQLGKPIDGHAPGLRGEALKNYIAAGISTDHESFTYEEGLEKLQLGMKLLIREGSAAKNFEALIDLLPLFPGKIMFCSDDKHPDDLMAGHINQLVARALARGCDLYEVLDTACITPVAHYGLAVGLLRVGDPADFITTTDIKEFHYSHITTYINGEKVAENGQSLIPSLDAATVNHFTIEPIAKSALEIPVPDCHSTGYSPPFNRVQSSRINVIKAINGEIITQSFVAEALVENGLTVSDINRDILKIAVINRYQPAPPALAFIHGFGLKKGALATCVGHDSHNIIAVGVDDNSMTEVVNAIITNRGGIAACADNTLEILPLPIAGIMTNQDAYQTADRYSELDQMVKMNLGSPLSAPFMTLSFMALLVIPSLKLSDLGLFDGEIFAFKPLFVQL